MSLQEKLDKIRSPKLQNQKQVRAMISNARNTSGDIVNFAN